MHNKSLDEVVSIYPNPVVDVANVTIMAEGEIVYRRYSTDGTMIYSEIATESLGETHTIDMSGCISGVYFLELEIEGQKTTITIIKK